MHGSRTPAGRPTRTLLQLATWLQTLDETHVKVLSLIITRECMKNVTAAFSTYSRGSGSIRAQTKASSTWLIGLGSYLGSQACIASCLLMSGIRTQTVGPKNESRVVGGKFHLQLIGSNTREEGSCMPPLLSSKLLSVSPSGNRAPPSEQWRCIDSLWVNHKVPLP